MFTCRGIAVALLIPTLVLGACGMKADSNTQGPEGGPTVSGKVVISGSSTVEPISALVREDFIAQNDKVSIDVDGPGTGDGFKLFCAGKTDISDASRPIKPEEAADCKKAGIEFIELKVAIDGISVIVPESNTMKCLSFADLYALTGPESEGFKTWADAQSIATASGSKTEFPTNNLVITAPGTESGTYDSFVELVIDKAGEARVASGDISKDELSAARADYSASPDDNAIIEGVSTDAGGLGWVGFAFADQAKGVRLMPISVEPGGDCVAPTTETIQDGSYPISRSLYIYVNKAKADSNKAVSDYVDFYLAGLDDFVTSSDYIPLADDAPTRKAWKDQTVGTSAS